MHRLNTIREQAPHSVCVPPVSTFNPYGRYSISFPPRRRSQLHDAVVYWLFLAPISSIACGGRRSGYRAGERMRE